MWYIWQGANSPLFGKDKMATFERYFLAEKELWKEKKNAYYLLLEDENVMNGILDEFGLDREISHIINGHVPVKKCLLLMADFQKRTRKKPELQDTR